MYSFQPFIIKEISSKLTGINNTPLARSGHRVVCDEVNLYSYGGFNPVVSEGDAQAIGSDTWSTQKPLFKELWKFNVSTRTWKRVLYGESMPNELASNAVILDGGMLMIFGGTGFPFGLSNCTNALRIFNLYDNFAFRVVHAEGDSPPKQYGQAVILKDTYLYTFGGTSGFDYSADIHRLNLSSKLWEEVYICKGVFKHEPEGRYRHEVVFDGTAIYVLGGGTASTTFDFRVICSFNFITKRWKRLPAIPDPAFANGFPGSRRCHGCVQLPNSSVVFICGGYDGETMYNDVWKLELNNLQWTCVTRCVLPEAVYFHSAALTPAGCMYSFGGVITRGDTVHRTNKLYCSWMCIPKLSEICWEALLHYNPDIGSYSKKHLLNIGVPWNYVRRLSL